MRTIVAALIVLGASACAATGRPVEVLLETEAGRPVVRVTGLSSAEISALASSNRDEAAWQDLLRVTVAGGPADQPAVTGRYAVAAGTITFQPTYGFDPGRKYQVDFHRSRVPGATHADDLSTVVSFPAETHAATTTVTRVSPTGDEVPENLLRLYIEFSAPMSRAGGLGHVRLLDDQGREVVDPFLPLDVDLWSPDYRRFTLFLDPGRVKTGILPHEQMGRALDAGRTYQLEIGTAWPDANGQPLAAPYRRTFRASGAEERPIDPAGWSIAPPRSGTRDPLVVTFGRALDRGLLMRTLGVAPIQEPPLDGSVEVGAGERDWRFVPASPWHAGRYDLLILGILEDPAGNRIGRAFEVDRFDRVDDRAAETIRRPFDVR